MFVRYQSFSGADDMQKAIKEMVSAGEQGAAQGRESELSTSSAAEQVDYQPSAPPAGQGRAGQVLSPPSPPPAAHHPAARARVRARAWPPYAVPPPPHPASLPP